MKTIWKIPLIVAGEQDILLPKGSEILSCQFQHGMLCLWAEVDHKACKETRIISIFGTGHPILEGSFEYITTVQEAKGDLVWHIYERIS